MKKTLWIIVTVAVLGTIAVYAAPSKTEPLSNQSPATISTTTAATPTPTPSLVSTVSATPSVVSNSLQDGTYTGDSVVNRFGDVQISISVSGGKITAVDFVSMPDDDSRSATISDYAQPLLEESTLAAQNADIDTISGATYTSLSYIESLQSAIDQAKI